VSFFPFDGAVYYGQPLSDLSQDEYAKRVEALPPVDWARLAVYETGVSEAAQTFACVGGACSIV